MPTCNNCKEKFPNKIKIDGKTYSLIGRKFCPNCSGIGTRNTRQYVVDLNEDEAFCVKCLKIKKKNEFYIRKSGRTFSYCIECQKTIKNIKLQEKLERIVEERNGCCAECGMAFPVGIYEFYLDGVVYQISKAKNMSFDKLKTALTNYIMLCPNCCAIKKWGDS